jgi:putative SOS response-associated peptidase YedK
MSTPFHACYFAYELTRRRPAAVADRLKSCTIPTPTPNAVTSAVHDRMPVILDRDSYDLWLDPGMTDFKVVSEMLKPYDAS